jgi:hypothetical protein
MRHKEPPPVAILAARLMRAYPSLSPYSAASLAVELCAIERAQHRHAERQCSGEDGGYVKLRNRTPERDGPLALAGRLGGLVAEHDPVAEERAGERIARRVFRWKANVWDRAIGPAPGDPAGTSGVVVCDITLHGDPRGAVLKLRLPGEAEAVAV